MDVKAGKFLTCSMFLVSSWQLCFLYTCSAMLRKSEHLLLIMLKMNQYCELLRTALDKHAPPSPRKVINHNSFPWFVSIRDELFIAKRERRRTERKWRNTTLTIFKVLYRQSSKLVHTAKCKFYTERIALGSFREELHQIVRALSN